MFTTIIEKLYADVRDVKEILLSDINKAETNITRHNFNRVNFKAGSHIRQHFQDQQNEVHEVNVTNGILAEIVSNEIQKVHDKIVLDSNNLRNLTMLFNSVGSVVAKCTEQLEILKTSVENVELGIITLEESIREADVARR